MDIEYLLLLQNFRNNLGGLFDSFFVFISQINVSIYILLIPLIIYWTIDKRKGIFIYCTYGIGNFFNAFLKSTFCVYRPWIRDSRVKPLESVISGATGYSFPSGHATNASSVYTPLAYKFRKHKGVVIASIIMICLTMFSRNFVGVHTPQDVIVGCLCGLASTWIILKIENYIEKNPDNDKYVLLISVIMTAVLLFYVSYKTYPIDFVDGKLLVDPEKMKRNSFTCPGLFLGTVIAWFLERRYLKLDIRGTTYQKIMRCVFGVLLLAIYEMIVIGGVGNLVNTNFFSFLLQLFEPVFAMIIYPLTWKCFNLK